MLDFLFNLLYPPKCPGCGHLVQQQGDWCHTCLTKIWRPRAINRTPACWHLAGCYCLVDYRGAARQVLHDLKYRQKQSRAAHCRYFLARFPWPERLRAIDLVVPVPLAPEKEAQRGFNQVEVIFRDWALLHWPWDDVLQRRRQTVSQWSLKQDERRENMRRAFVVKQTAQVKNKHILLVDDIYTTGATLDSCAGALKEKGAASVTGLVIASGAP